MGRQCSQKVKRIGRSKNKHSVLFYFYRYALFTFVGFILLLLAIALISDGLDAFPFDFFMCMVIISTISVLCISLVGKGSLVESVEIDYPQREIRVTHYRLPFTLCERKLSFDGFRWDVLKGHLYAWSRLRLKPKEGKKVVVCMEHLGWEIEDCWALMDALSVITPKDKKWYD